VRRAPVAPSQERLPVMLYLHGGGFVIGGLDTHDSLCRQFALRAGVAVLSLDYRLAPEHRFPVAVDDSFAACAGWRARARTPWGWMAAAWPWAATARAAPCRRSAP
jgi:acetyl esterase